MTPSPAVPLSPLRAGVRTLWAWSLPVLLVLSLSACGQDDVGTSSSACPEGQKQDAVTGECRAMVCSPTQVYNEALDLCVAKPSERDMRRVEGADMAGRDMAKGGLDAGGGVDMAMRGDMGLEVDMSLSEEEQCNPNLDSDDDGLSNKCECDLMLQALVADSDGNGIKDGEDDPDADGLSNACECEILTDAMNPDSDGDGLKDGEEDKGACGIDQGETLPGSADTDNDGLSDKEELDLGLDPLDRDSDGDGIDDGIEVDIVCLDPLKEDSDGDGLSDGAEDTNFDGKVGSCMPGVFDLMCAMGESDPCEKDSDGDGRPDSEEVRYRKCTPADKANLPMPNLLKNMRGNYQLGLAPATTQSPVTSATNAALDADVFENVPAAYTGFVANLPAPMMNMSPVQLADHVLATTNALPGFASITRRSDGRQTTTHDGLGAIVGGAIDLPATTSPSAARDLILAALSGSNDLVHSLMGSIPGGAATSTLFYYQVIAKSQTDYLIVGGFATASKVDEVMAETGWRMADLVGGSSVADATELLEPDCVAFDVTASAEVDIIIAMDNSGSMVEERMALVGFIDDLIALLNAANLDWRIGVTGVECDGIKNDSSLNATPRVRDLFPAGGGGLFPIPVGGPCPGGGIFGGGGTKGNGRLEVSGGKSAFTREAAEIKKRINQVSGTNAEYTITMGIAAIERATPRAANKGDKIRPDAAIVVVGITDEEDDFFSETVGFLPKAPGATLSAMEQAELEMKTQPWLDYLALPDVNATVFGLYAVPNTTCPMGAAKPLSQGLAIQDIVTRSGGSGGSVCQADITTTLQSIASATAGISSNLRLSGAALATSVLVKQFGRLTGMETQVPRSRQRGFDFDAIVNRISFFGAMPPQTGDRLIIPYLRWKDSVVKCQKDSDCPREGVRQVCDDIEFVCKTQ